MSSVNNITSVPVNDITLPEVIVAMPSEKNITSLSKILKKNPTDPNCIVTLAEIKNKLVLLNGYDIFLSAKRLKMHSINAIILDGIADPQIAHVIMSHKVHTNPIKIIDVMEKYVKSNGITKTLEKLHLEPVFGKIFSLGFSPKTKTKLDKLFSDAYDDGVNSVTPFGMLKYVSDLDPAPQIKLIEKLDGLRANNKGRFRWPHNEYLRNLVEPKSKQTQNITTENTDDVIPISDGFRTFTCICKKEYFVNKLRITPKKIQQGMQVMEGDLTLPILEISKKHIAHLGITPDKYPHTIISGTDDLKNILKKLKNKKFVIYVGPDN